MMRISGSRKRRREEGQGLVELLLLLSLVAIVAIVSLSFLGTQATGLVDHVNRGLTQTTGSAQESGSGGDTPDGAPVVTEQFDN